MIEEKKETRVTAYYATAEDYKRMGHYTMGTFHRFLGTETHREVKGQSTSQAAKTPAISKRR
jgi:hypothetical protein